MSKPGFGLSAFLYVSSGPNSCRRSYSLAVFKDLVSGLRIYVIPHTPAGTSKLFDRREWTTRRRISELVKLIYAYLHEIFESSARLYRMYDSRHAVGVPERLNGDGWKQAYERRLRLMRLPDLAMAH